MVDAARPAEPVLIAMLVENTEFTGNGVAAVICMCIVLAVAVVSVIVFPTNAIQQAASSLVALLLIIPLGVGAIIGRKRSYKVFREVRRDESTRQQAG